MKNKIIIDTDPGIDDAMAILFAEASNNIDLIGITTVFGNVDIDKVTKNALYIKEKFNLSADISTGHANPLKLEKRHSATVVHGENGLGDIDIPETLVAKTTNESATDYIINMVNKCPNEITIVAIGSLTNIADIVKKSPEAVNNIKEVVVMGGAFGTDNRYGNVSPYAEANIFSDPHAADIVFTSNIKVTVIGLDVTEATIVTSDYLDDLRLQSKKYGQFIYDISRFYLNFYRKYTNVDGFHMHDSSAIAYIADPSLFTKRKGPIRVVCSGPALGHTIQKTSEKIHAYDEWSNIPPQDVCVGVDSEKLLKLYKNTMCQ